MNKQASFLFIIGLTFDVDQFGKCWQNKKLLMNVKSQLFNWRTAFIIMTNLTAAATAAVH